jgi:hypothetical protein
VTVRFAKAEVWPCSGFYRYLYVRRERVVPAPDIRRDQLIVTTSKGDEAHDVQLCT